MADRRRPQGRGKDGVYGYGRGVWAEVKEGKVEDEVLTATPMKVSSGGGATMAGAK